MKFTDFCLFLAFAVLIFLLGIMMPEPLFAVISDPYLFLAFVVLISLSGVMMPGPLFAVTIEKATKRKNAGLLISIGHGIVEFPLMFLIYYVLAQFVIPDIVKITVMLIGGLLMIYIGVQMFRNKNNINEKHESSKQDSLIAGIWATAANPGFIVWWLTIGFALIMNAQSFGLLWFLVFAATHWLCDFLWYTFVAVVIFKSQRFWTEKVRQVIFIFCFAVFVGFGAWFLSLALWSTISTLV
jgi:threonine/homoserine/homoserine lactone efflux protein